MALTVIEPELLLFVSVTFCVLLVPTISLPKSSDVELAESCRVGAVPLSPLPVSDIRDGEIFTLLESEGAIHGARRKRKERHTQVGGLSAR